ncbi:HlyD family type I secretion periplasmic adaptor subunit [Nitratireductor sp. XY-223]|uniref:HlyD family type I secretion periplasmic adaptor subunit n=1 Tax=Nitratireductor sp. XY-223 TaxID=2561926 RepID=UPI0010AAF763|nr:HlyD family type I secretion periplasmic adaptor subunit [Nitratireductor sp. XY-223]
MRLSIDRQPQPAAPPDGPSVRTSARRTIRLGLALMVLLFVVGGGWASFARLSGAVVSQGKVSVAGRPKDVQHADGGLIAEIRVADGERVEQGEPLIRLDDTLLRAEFKVHAARLREAVARLARLEAERDGLDAIRWRDDLLDINRIISDPAVRHGQERLFEARRQSRNGQVSRLREKIAQFENQVKGTLTVIRSNGRQIASLDQELTGVRQLREKGLATASRVLNLERQRETLTGRIGELEAAIARTENAISETELQILQIDHDFREEVLATLRQAAGEYDEVSQLLKSTQERMRRVEITAPASGIVHDLNVFTIGGVVGAAETLMKIVPQDKRFEIETRIEPGSIDEVFAGQSAQVRFSAFNLRTTPELVGTVTRVSADVLHEPGGGAPYYTVYVDVAEEELATLEGLDLIAGMPVEVFIQTRRRSVLNYALKPLSDQIRRAFRES